MAVCGLSWSWPFWNHRVVSSWCVQCSLCFSLMHDGWREYVVCSGCVLCVLWRWSYVAVKKPASAAVLKQESSVFLFVF